jgi:hypothetical protein
MSKKKLPRINPAAFASAAVAQPDPVRTATKAAKKSTLPVTGRKQSDKPSREGRVQIMGWFPAETRLALKRVALESNKTLEHVMGEAFAAYLARAKK